MTKETIAAEPSSSSTQPIQIEEQFRIMADTAPVLIWISGTDKLCYFFNAEWLRFSGRTMEQEYGNGWAEGVHPDDFNRCLDIYITSFDARKEFKMEYRLKRHDGVYRWILDHGVPRYTASGEFAGYIGSCIDVQEKNEVEEELEKKVAQRTKELQVAIAELKRSNEELEQFAYAASHDMKEPIRKIKFYSDSLLFNQTNVKPFATKIQEAANRMYALMDNLLHLSKIRKEEDLFEAVDLNRILANVKNDLELAIAEKGAIIRAGDLPLIKAIPEQMHQLFYNLVGNGLKYCAKGIAPLISISTKEAGSDAIETHLLHSSKKYIEIIVKDNGIGFDQKEAEKIFAIFQRLHSRDEFPGSGIGLALCKKCVQNHGGAIYAKSAKGEGSSFHILLPLVSIV